MQEGSGRGQDMETSGLALSRCRSSSVVIDSSGEKRISRNSSMERASSRSSRRRASISLSRDVSGRLLECISLSREIADQILGEIDSSVIAQVGDSGDRVVEEGRLEDDEMEKFSIDQVQTTENEFVTDPFDALRLSNDFHPSNAKLPSRVLPLSEMIAPTDAILQTTQKNQPQVIKEKQEKLPQILDHMCYLIYLAFFGILGALTRYLLQKLFGPGHLALTGDDPFRYPDLPSNILGSFLMGWFGVVLKADISHLSAHLAVGITTGYLGSLTTFSGWIMKMLDLSARGRWVEAVAGCVLGSFMVTESIACGVASGTWVRQTLLAYCTKSLRASKYNLESCRANASTYQTVAMIAMLLIVVSFCGLSLAQAMIELDNSSSVAILWLGCLVGAPGVWARWYLARLNGQGIGRKGLLKWLPIGTLSANVLAACIMAALSTINKAVNTKQCGLAVSGVQFGFLGCLSTVSTFMAEVYAMRNSGNGGRAFAYVAATILLSFALGTLIYSIPVWTKHYH